MTRFRMRATESEPMRRMPWGLMLCVLILGAALAGCDGPNRGSNTQVQAKVWDVKGKLVDGALVTFSTTLCCFANEDEINLVGLTVATNRGTASAVFCGTQQRGTATITGSVEDAFDTVLITVF